MTHQKPDTRHQTKAETHPPRPTCSIISAPFVLLNSLERLTATVLDAPVWEKSLGRKDWRTGRLEDWRTGTLGDWRTGQLEDLRTGGLED